MSTEYIIQTHLRNTYSETGLPLQIAHPLGNGETEAYRKYISKVLENNLFKFDWWSKLRVSPTMFQY